MEGRIVSLKTFAYLLYRLFGLGAAAAEVVRAVGGVSTAEVVVPSGGLVEIGQAGRYGCCQKYSTTGWVWLA